jgi:hypothetical protein
MSDRISRSVADAITFSVASSPDDVTIKTPALSDLSPGDKPWDKHRNFADRVQSHYNGSEFQSLFKSSSGMFSINRFWIDYAGEQFQS